MHTVTQLHVAMPEARTQIRRSHYLTKAAVIAESADAARTMAVTTAVEHGMDADYHLVHVFECPPKVLTYSMPHEHNVLELRPTTWHRLECVIRAFLSGADEEELIRCSR